HTIDKKNVKGNIRDKNLQDKELFDYFINDLCRHFIPRGIRTTKRRSMFLNVSLDFAPEPAGNAEPKSPVKANTVDVSEDGSFILGNMEVRRGDTFRLVINELENQAPIECMVKWVLPWGETANHLPGFGASFGSLGESQKEELVTLLRRRVS
ncbi:MAG: hypothetical protein GY940_17905, partial [bacterium]|nr:hypothetical protein [bacterium]